jgi:hypothetical protein
MDILNLKNMQLAYGAVYDEVLYESMEDLGIIGEARDGYGDDSKFNKPDDKMEKPGTTVPAPKKGGYGRIYRNVPYGIGAHKDRITSKVTRITGGDKGEPRATKMVTDDDNKPKKPKMVKRGGKWVKVEEAYEFLLSHLLDEGYAETFESAEAILENMSDEWIDEVLEEGRGNWSSDNRRNRSAMQSAMSGDVWSTHPASRTRRDIKPRQSSRPQSNYRGNLSDRDRAELAATARKERKAGENFDPDYTPSNKKIKKALKNLPLRTRNPRKLRKQSTMGESYDLYDIILEYLIQEGYAESLGTAEIIMENMSDEWIDEVLEEGYKKLPVGKMIKQAARKGQNTNPFFGGSSSGDEEAYGKRISDINRMARVASRHSLIKGKGKVRGQGQAELNRRRGEG